MNDNASRVKARAYETELYALWWRYYGSTLGLKRPHYNALLRLYWQLGIVNSLAAEPFSDPVKAAMLHGRLAQWLTDAELLVGLGIGPAVLRAIRGRWPFTGKWDKRLADLKVLPHLGDCNINGCGWCQVRDRVAVEWGSRYA